MPLLSIITINLNNAAGLQKTIDSVLLQTFTDFEFIIIDGGSTDGSRGVIEKHNDKINHLVSENDNGIFHAMNKGIAKATGQFIQFLNSGDALYNKDVLEKIFHDKKLNEPEIIYGDTLFIYPNGKTLRKNAVEKLSIEYLINDDINHQSCFIKRTLFEKFGLYDETLKIAGDHKFFLTTLVLNNTTYKYYNEIISTYNLEGLSFVNQDLQNKERNEVQKEILPELIYNLYAKFALEKNKKDKRLWTRIEAKLKKYLSNK